MSGKLLVGKSPVQWAVACVCLGLGAAVVAEVCLKQAGAAEAGQTMKLVSPAFAEGQPIPAAYTCDGKNISPPLKWGSVPPGTRSLALICEDPDAPGGTWTHWVYYGLPGSMTELPAGVPAVENPPSGGRQGRNSFKHTGYGGPCPPAGRVHRYIFRIYALDNNVSIKPNTGRTELLRAVQGHVIAQGELMGTYQKKT